MAGAVAFVLKGYPRLSETFIAQEILALERRGLDIRIVSLRQPTDQARHPVHDRIAAPVHYLPEYLGDDWGRVRAAWRAARRLPGYRAARNAWLRDLRRDPTSNRVRRFGQALVLASELPAGVTHLHAHFLHTPASVARYAAILTGLAWSGSAHAKDIWTTPEWEKRQKLADAAWFATCTEAARAHLAELAPDPAKVALAYHGLDLADAPAPLLDRPPRAGAGPADAVRLLTVGRAVEKKGLDVLIEALALLPPGLHWRLSHIGGGTLRAELERRAEALGLADRIEWLGAQPRPAVFARYREADLFVLPCRVAADGDRDGLPNVLMEAQSQGLACLSTRLSGIPELIEDGVTGALVPPGDAPALAAALSALIAAPARRARLARAGAARIRARFSHEPGIERLAARFGLAAAEAAAAETTPAASATRAAGRVTAP